jgi:predicted GNAT family acetyltransferase
MEEVGLRLNSNGRGYFLIKENGEELGQMEVSVIGNQLTAFHTEVVPKAKGKGYAKKFLNEMVSYSKKNNLKVKALCPFVHAQFKRHPEQYGDIIKK